MKRQWVLGVAVLTACVGALLGCSSGSPGSAEEITESSAALAPWARSDFRQVLRVNANEDFVRNRCELVVRLSEPTPMTFVASEPLDAARPARAIGWSGGAASVPHLSVTACANYPCDVTATYVASRANGAQASCEVVADDGAARFVGRSDASTLTLPGGTRPTAAVITQQTVQLGPEGSAGYGMCLLRQNAELPQAGVAGFSVRHNGAVVASSYGIAIGASPWPTPGPALDFGALFLGTAADLTILKHVTPRSEQLAEGDTLRCAGVYQAQPGVTVFDLNVSNPPTGAGVSLVSEQASSWTCGAESFGTGDGCDADCGLLDPDCELSTDPQNCGALGNACAAWETCANGTCVAKPGYAVWGPWRGFASTAANATSSISPADFSGTAFGGPFCASGTLSPQPDGSAYASVAYNVMQDPGAEPTTWAPAGEDFLELDLSGDTAGLQVVLSGPSGTWCANLMDRTQIPFAEFNSACGGGAGAGYAGEPIRSVRVVVPGYPNAQVSFNFCLNRVEPRDACAPGSADDPDDSFLDSNCDGIDGDAPARRSSWRRTAMTRPRARAGLRSGQSRLASCRRRQMESEPSTSRMARTQAG